MITIENQRALDPIIDGLVKRLRSIKCTTEDLQYTVERILNEAVGGDEDQRLANGGIVASRVMGSFAGRFFAQVANDLGKAENFQVQAENAKRSNLAMVQGVGHITPVTEALTDEQIKLVEESRHITVKSFPIPAKVQKAISRGLELGADAADSSVRSRNEAQ